MIKFFKMHGLGNDYIFIDSVQNQNYLNYKELAKIICKRNFGVGADGLIVILKGQNCDAKMEIYNKDGSKANLCGNATRCVAYYLFKKYKIKNPLIQSGKKLLKTKIISSNGKKAIVCVNMGKCEYEYSKTEQILNKNYKLNIFDIGNKHCVVFVDDFNFDYKKVAEYINKKLFQDGINVEFVKIINDTSIKIKVYERGSGITLACGSGACASAFAYKFLFENVLNNINVELDGGFLKIIFNKNASLAMLGKCNYVFKGEF